MSDVAARFKNLCKTDPIFAFEHQFRIRTYDADSMRWGLSPFILNDEQRLLHTEVQRQMGGQGFARIVIDKARKLGMSTYIQCLKMHTCMYTDQMHALTVAHEDKATRELFRIGKRIVENCDDRVAPELLNKPRGNRIEWANGSRAESQTQGGSPDSERGSTPTFLHISELPSWETIRRTTSAADVAQALLNAVPTTRGTMIFIESTAMGTGNLFYEIWNRAVKNERGNLFVPMFFSWTGRKAYSVPAPSPATAKEEVFLDERMRKAHKADDTAGFHAAANDLGYSNLQRKRAIEFDLNPDQIRFWRQTLVNACNNDQDRFDQEWPLSWQISFVSSGRGVFSARLIQDRMAELEKFVPRAVGSLLRDKSEVKCYQDGGGWEIYEWPKQDHRYIVSGDASGGGRGKDDDFACIQVFDRATETQVAEFYDKVPPDQLGEQMALASILYNNAMAAPECNGPGLVTVHHLVNKHPTCIIYRRFSQPGQVAGSETRLLGYSTNVKTRHFLFGQFESAVRRNEITIYSKRLLGEMLTLIRAKNTGKPEAASGYHDDACVAMAIALDVSRQQADQGIEAVKEVVTIDPTQHIGFGATYNPVVQPLEDDQEAGLWF